MSRALKTRPNACPHCGATAERVLFEKVPAWRIIHRRACFFRQPSGEPHQHFFFGQKDRRQRGWNWRQPQAYSTIHGLRTGKNANP